MQAAKIAVLSFVMFSTANMLVTASTTSELAKYTAAYTASNCPNPADYFSDSQCLDFFCGYFGVCSGSYSTPSTTDYSYFCGSSTGSSEESKLRCANDLFLLAEVGATVSSNCTAMLDLTKYACTFDSVNAKYCDLAPYLGTVSGDVCTGTLSCCNFVFNSQDAVKSACYPTSTGSSDLSSLSYKCTNPFYFDYTDLDASGPSRIQEFCPEIYDYDNNAVKSYKYFEAECEDYVADFIAGLTDSLTTSVKYDKGITPATACTKCSKDLKAIAKLASASSDLTCSVLAQGITAGCTYDSYTSQYCVAYDMYPSSCDKEKYSCCRSELTTFVDAYTSTVLSDTVESVLDSYYTITQFSACTDAGFIADIATISSVCTEKVDINEASVKFCPTLIDNDTKKLLSSLESKFSAACWADIQPFFAQVGSSSLDTASLCGSCSDDLATLVALFKADSDKSCGVVAALAEATCLKDYASSSDFYCGSFDLIANSSECDSVSTSSCCQDALSEAVADAVAVLTDAQKIALDGLLYVPTYKTVCGSGKFTVDVADCSLPLDFCPELLDTESLAVLATISIKTDCESSIRSLFSKLGTGSVDAATLCGTCKDEVDRIVELVAQSTDESCLAVSALVDWACTVDTTDNTYCGAYNIVDSLTECAGASCCQSLLISDLAEAETSMNEAQKAAIDAFATVSSVDTVCGTGFSATQKISDSQCKSPDETNASFKPSFTFISVLLVGVLMFML